jgi:hypothetical protein
MLPIRQALRKAPKVTNAIFLGIIAFTTVTTDDASSHSTITALRVQVEDAKANAKFANQELHGAWRQITQISCPSGSMAYGVRSPTSKTLPATGGPSPIKITVQGKAPAATVAWTTSFPYQVISAQQYVQGQRIDEPPEALTKRRFTFAYLAVLCLSPPG